MYKSVTAKAVEKSTVIRLPMDAFKEIFEESPDILIRVIQVIMIRLQRVTFTALRNYLGLSSELVQNKPKRGSIILKQSPIHKKQFPDLNPVHSLSTEALTSRPDMLADLSDVRNRFDDQRILLKKSHTFSQMYRLLDILVSPRVRWTKRTSQRCIQ